MTAVPSPRDPGISTLLNVVLGIVEQAGCVPSPSHPLVLLLGHFETLLLRASIDTAGRGEWQRFAALAVATGAVALAIHDEVARLPNSEPMLRPLRGAIAQAIDREARRRIVQSLCGPIA